MVRASDTNGIVIITQAADHRRVCGTAEVLPSVPTRLNVKRPKSA